MNDTLITIIAIFVAAVLIFVVPLMTMSDRFDATTQAQVESLVTNFVEDARTTGEITQEKYSKFQNNLASTGYSFGTDMEVKVLDENPGKKTLQTAKDKIGENVYYSEYTSQIEDKLNSTGKYDMKKGDIITVKVRNTNKTMSQQLKSFAYKITGNDEATVVATKSGMVQ